MRLRQKGGEQKATHALRVLVIIGPYFFRQAEGIVGSDELLLRQGLRAGVPSPLQRILHLLHGRPRCGRPGFVGRVGRPGVAPLSGSIRPQADRGIRPQAARVLRRLLLRTGRRRILARRRLPALRLGEPMFYSTFLLTVG